jgi:hypothetical protein
MAYIYNIPQPPDQLSNSQTQILANFTALGAIAGNGTFGSTSLNDVAGFNYLFLANQGMIPPTAFVAGNVALYSATNATTMKNELYITKTNQTTVTNIPATASTLSVTSAPAGLLGCWTYLPSGLLIKTGRVTTSTPLSAGVATINTSTISGGPNFTGILNIIICPASSVTTDVDFAVRYLNNSGQNFTAFFSNRTTTGPYTGPNYGLQYIVIGY